MKVVVYGTGEALKGVQAVQSAQVDTEDGPARLIWRQAGGRATI